MPKPAYQNTTSEAFWGISIHAEHNEVEQIGSTRDLSATRGKKSEAEVQWLRGWTVQRNNWRTGWLL